MRHTKTPKNQQRGTREHPSITGNSSDFVNGNQVKLKKIFEISLGLSGKPCVIFTNGNVSTTGYFIYFKKTETGVKICNRYLFKGVNIPVV